MYLISVNYSDENYLQNLIWGKAPIKKFSSRSDIILHVICRLWHIYFHDFPERVWHHVPHNGFHQPHYARQTLIHFSQPYSTIFKSCPFSVMLLPVREFLLLEEFVKLK